MVTIVAFIAGRLVGVFGLCKLVGTWALGFCCRLLRLVLCCVVNSVVYFNSLFKVVGLVWVALLEVPGCCAFWICVSVSFVV